MSDQPEIPEGNEPEKTEEQEQKTEVEEKRVDTVEELVTATEAVEPEAVKPAEGGEATGEEPIAEVHAPATDESGASPPTAEETPSQEPSAEPTEIPASGQAEQVADKPEVIVTESGDAEVKEEKETVDATQQNAAAEEAAELPPVMEIQVATPAPGEEEEVLLEVQGSPHDDAIPLQVEGDLPQPGTPERIGSELDEEELIVEEESPRYNREELVQQYQAAMQEREQLTQQNRALQHKLSEYFRKKKTDDTRQEIEKTAADQEQRYMKYMSNLEELRQQQTAESESYQEQLGEMKERKAEKQEKVEEEWNKAVEFKRNVALSAINSRTGRPIPPKDIEMYEANERKKELEVSQVRLEYIKLKNRLKKQELQLKQKEELAEGLHLIDFEQLKIENQTYNEKIEERNEELLKLRKKITNTVQVLTHLKEKLQFVQAENTVKKEQLAVVEKEVAQKRDILSRTKQARDRLRHENNKFQQKCGLLGNTDLLKDFEVSTDEASELTHRLDLLKRTHAELTLSLSGIKKKIELTKGEQQS